MKKILLILLFAINPIVTYCGEIDLLLHLTEDVIHAPTSAYVYPMFNWNEDDAQWGIFHHVYSEIQYSELNWGIDSALDFSVGMLSSALDSDGMTFSIASLVEDKEEFLFRKSINLVNDNEQGLHYFSIPLPDPGDATASLIFRTNPHYSGDGGHDSSDWGFWGSPIIRWKSEKPKGTYSNQNVILITIDTLRYDYLHRTGNPYIKTPHLDSMIDEGVLFTQAFSNSSTTNPSHASLLSSQLPYSIEMNSNINRFKEYIPRIQELFQDQNMNYRTGAAVSVFHFHPEFTGFGAGFDHFSGIDPYWTMNVGSDFALSTRSAATTTSAAIEWIDERPDQPFFLWIHYYDPHAPYIASGEFRKKYYPWNPSSELHSSMQNAIYASFMTDAWNFWVEPYTDLEYFKREYSAEISSVDHQIGRLKESLGESELLDQTLMVVTADHGENLGDHNVFFDHWTMYNTDLHVPLIFWQPETIPAGVRIDDPVTLLDVSPTIAELSGLQDHAIAKNFFKGDSLVPAMQGGLLPPNRISIAHGLYFMHSAAWTDQYKIIWEVIGGRYHEKYTLLPDRVFVFDRKNDPGETNPVAAFYWQDDGKEPLPWEVRNVPFHGAKQIEERMAESRLRIADKRAPSADELGQWFTSGSERNKIQEGWLDRQGFLEEVALLMDELLESVRPGPIELEIEELREWRDSFDSIDSIVDNPAFRASLKSLGYL